MQVMIEAFKKKDCITLNTFIEPTKNSQGGTLYTFKFETNKNAIGIKFLGHGCFVAPVGHAGIMEDTITESQAEEKRLPGLEDVILTIDAMSA